MTAMSFGEVFVIAGDPGALATAIADRLQATGGTVAMVDINTGHIQVQTPAGRPGDIEASGYRVESGTNAARQVARVLHMVGRVDGLINLVPPPTKVDRLATDVDTFASSFYSVLALSQSVFSAWMHDNGGSITNVLSVRPDHEDSSMGSVGDALILMLTRELAAELDGLVDVNAIVVGPIDSALETLLGSSIKRPAALEPGANQVDTIAKAVFEVQTSGRGNRHGEVLVLDFA
jgi:NAD(P)-dependent dehydrogenase (short-subunit alcohol dehydrogenase family)